MLCFKKHGAEADVQRNKRFNSDWKFALGDSSVSGAGTIVRVDNADLKDTDLYVANTRKAWHGCALVIYQKQK